MSQPLAAALRPKTLTEYIGQQQLVGDEKPLRVALEMGHIFSLILWGPPGVGKTTLARIIAESLNKEFIELSAVSAGKKDIAKVVESTKQQKTLTQSYESPILFLDEIHRFNKAQQDFLLPFVEDGTLILIGATTENPSFEVIAPLLSRLKVFRLEPLSDEDISILIKRSIEYFKEHKKISLSLSEVCHQWLINYAAGDARKLLTILEHTVTLYQKLSIPVLKKTAQSQHIGYDKKGDSHYDTISAYIKSMRASNQDAAMYYLARMVSAGEDPKFIARRMVIFASEDIGLAQPTALVVANAVFEAVRNIGYPEAQINLAHGTAYMCACKKNRSAYDAFFAAARDVQQYGNLPIPLNLRNAPTDLMKQEGYGKGYEAYPDKDTSLLPKKLLTKKYFKDHD